MLISPASVRRLGVSAAAAALVLAGLVAVTPASATPLAPATTPPPTSGPSVSGHMGEYPEAAFAAAAAKLPSALVAALHRDLGITSEEYLAQASASADAVRTLASLKAEGVKVRDARMEGTTFRVFVSTAADAAAVEQLGAVADRGAVTKVDYSTKKFVKATDVYGGSPYGWSDGTFVTFCSIGFPGYKVSTGAPQAVTAGHCFEDINTIQGTLHSLNFPTAGDPDSVNWSDNGSLGTLVSGSNQFGGNYDSALINDNTSGITQRSSVLTWGGGAGAPTTSTPVYDASSPVTGQSVCKSGLRTGWTCGSVLATDQVVSVSGQLVNTAITTACVLPGDSGGSLVAGGFALGVISASTAQNSCTSGDESAAFPMVSAVGGASHPSVKSQQTDWEPMVTVPTPILTSPSAGGVATTFIGARTASTSTSLVAKLTIDGTTTLTASAPNGAFSIPLTSVSAGSHTYSLKLTWGTKSESTAVTGSFRKVAVSRIAGSDRFVNADLIAKAAYPSGASTVYVTNGLNYPDALSAGPVAVAAGAPIVLNHADLAAG